MLNDNEFNENENFNFSDGSAEGGNTPENMQTENSNISENSAKDFSMQVQDSPESKPVENPNVNPINDNLYGTYQNNSYSQSSANSYSDEHHAPYGQTNQSQNSAGIRYDADKSNGDGNYTWNYYGSQSGQMPGKTHEKRRSKGFVAFMAVVVAFVVVGTAALSAVITSNYIKTGRVTTFSESVEEYKKPVIGQNNANNSNEPQQTIGTVIDNGNALSKQAIAVKCKPSSVGIEVTSKSYSIYGYSYQTSGVGSGFILTEDGYIATNHHVIEDADKITVQLDDGTKHDAVLIGSDSITDLAVLKIEASGLIPMEIGDSDKMVVGDSVIAIGTPAGIEFAGTVTDGIISAINRNVEITNERGTIVKTMTLMQTNAAINPGNSGGPLINDMGQVIGINTLKLTSSYEGIGFSIPINSAVKIFNQLISDGKVSEYDNSFVSGNGAIGITQYAEVSKQEAEYYGIPEGIIVIQIKNTSSAVSAGLRRGDMIIGFCGTEVKTVDELNKLKSKYKAGDQVTLRIYRDGEGEKDITFNLDIMDS